MASLEYLREEMASALAIMDDKSKPSEVRRAARARFWHCEKRVGTMERGGFTEDDPGHFMLGYSELGYAKPRKAEEIASLTEAKKQREKEQYANLVMSAWDAQEHNANKGVRRDLIEQKTEAHFKAKERL